MIRSLTILIFLIYLSNESFAFNYENVYRNFKKGDYLTALKDLEAHGKRTRISDPTFYYIKGLCESRLQRHDKAIISFNKSIRLKSDAKDIYFERGQSLYAANELEKSRKSFAKSNKLNFKSPTSLYYIAHISQILEENKRAKSYYSKVLKHKDSTTGLKQSSRFQRAVVLFEMAKKKSDPKKLVKKYILPEMRKSLKIDEKSKVAPDIRKRIASLQTEYGLDPNKYTNGNDISTKRYTADISQSIDYDNNVTYTDSSSLTEATQQDSYVYTTSLFTDYIWVFNREFYFQPELSFDFVRHGNRDESEVYTNDYYEFLPKLNFGWQHKLFGKAAKFNLGYEYGYKARDRESKKEKIFYSRHHSFSFKESLSLFSFGDTSLMLTFKDNIGWEDSDDYSSFVVTIDQLYTTKNNHYIYFLYQADNVDLPESPTESTLTNFFRVDYIASNIVPEYTFDAAMSVSFLSYTDATTSETNGTEVTYNPSFKATKQISSNFEASFEYSYSKKTSQVQTSEYTKHVTGTELKYSF